jgi:catechol 2,3-dioxygenase-like lactoylglutathione lyase family enzyme
MMSYSKPGITVRGLAPLLMVFDMPASLHFYRNLLGFELVGTSAKSPDQGDHVGWALLRLDGTEIMLNTLYDEGEGPPALDPERKTVHYDTSIYFGCPDVDAAYEFMMSKGLEPEKPQITGYGFKAIYLTDPDGYSLVFHWPVNP